jgi:hypothetical protein
VAVKYRGSKAANKPIKSKIMMDDNFEKKCPIISKKAQESDIWLYVALVSALTALGLVV